MWAILLAMHVVGHVGYTLTLRKSLLADTDRWTLATLMQTAVTLPLVAVPFFYQLDYSIYTVNTLPVILIGSAMTILLHVSNVKALQYLEASVYSVIFSLRIILTTILGILFLNELFIPFQIVGGLLIFLAIVTVKQKGTKQTNKLGVQWGISAALTISLLTFLEKSIFQQMTFIDYVVPSWLLATTIMWIILLLRKTKIDRSILQPQLGMLMIFRALSGYGITLALAVGGLLSVTNYISSLSVILITLFGVILLGEKDYLKRKLVAAGLALAGFTSILITNLL